MVLVWRAWSIHEASYYAEFEVSEWWWSATQHAQDRKRRSTLPFNFPFLSSNIQFEVIHAINEYCLFHLLGFLEHFYNFYIRCLHSKFKLLQKRLYRIKKVKTCVLSGLEMAHISVLIKFSYVTNYCSFLLGRSIPYVYEKNIWKNKLILGNSLLSKSCPTIALHDDRFSTSCHSIFKETLIYDTLNGYMLLSHKHGRLLVC
jgi:hypothetical protein